MLCESACMTSVLWVCLQWPQVKILQRPLQGQASKPIPACMAPLKVLKRPSGAHQTAFTPPTTSARVPRVSFAVSLCTSAHTHGFGNCTLTVLHTGCAAYWLCCTLAVLHTGCVVHWLRCTLAVRTRSACCSDDQRPLHELHCMPPYHLSVL